MIKGCKAGQARWHGAGGSGGAISSAGLSPPKVWARQGLLVPTPLLLPVLGRGYLPGQRGIQLVLGSHPCLEPGWAAVVGWALFLYTPVWKTRCGLHQGTPLPFFSSSCLSLQLLMLKVQAVGKGKVFEDSSFLTATTALMGGIQLILPWFKKTSIFTFSLQSNPILTHAEVLPVHTVSLVHQERPFSFPWLPRPEAVEILSFSYTLTYLWNFIIFLHPNLNW